MKVIIKVVLTLLVIGFCLQMFVKHSGWFMWSHQPLQYMPNMHRTNALKPQRAYPFFENNASSRVPPVGSLAREQDPYKFKGEKFLADAVDRSENPLPVTEATLRKGKKIWDNHCVVCHGSDGNGNGSVVPKYPNPPSLMADKIRDYADSQIFHVITNGQNTMGSYAPQTRPLDRWAVVHYVRAMQLADRPAGDDLEAFDEIIKGGAK